MNISSKSVPISVSVTVCVFWGTIATGSVTKSKIIWKEKNNVHFCFVFSVLFWGWLSLCLLATWDKWNFLSIFSLVFFLFQQPHYKSILNAIFVAHIFYIFFSFWHAHFYFHVVKSHSLPYAQKIRSKVTAFTFLDSTLEFANTF